MKKKINRLLSVLLVMVMLCGTFTFPVAAEENIKVVLNSEELTFDVPPQLINDRTMVPMRVIFEALGADVYWIDFPYTEQMILAVKNEIKILMAIDQEELIKFIGNDFDKFIEYLDEGQPITLDVPPQLIDGRTLVPLRAVSEALGVEVVWEETTKTVALTCDDEFIKNNNTDKDFFNELIKFIEDMEEDEYSEERELFNESDDIKRIVIENSDPSNHEVFILESEKDVETLKNCFSKVSVHMGEGGDEEYRINFINDFTVCSIPFPDLFSQSQIGTVNSFIKDESKKYQYIFQVKNSIDFQALKQDSYNNGNIAYLPNNSINATKPYIELSYIAVAKDDDEWEKAFYGNNKIGEFKYDDYFIPFIDDLKEKGLYFDNGDVSFSSGNGLNFSRRIKVFLTRSLTENEIIEIQAKSKESYIIGDPQGFHPVTSFRYNEVEEYELKVIFDKEQSNEKIKAFCQKYNVDNFDYDKELLGFDNMTIYLLKNTISPDDLNPTECKSVVITKDLDLIYRKHEPVTFLPFKDADPPFSIIEQRKISEDDYQMIRRIISNYNILNISDNLGFGDYEFDRFCYIGIQIDGKLYVCGGQDPYSHNERFFNIRSKIMEILNIHF